MKIELPELKKQVYETRFPVRWGDMDAMGHVNNAQYFRYLETARIDWMRGMGLNPDPAGQAGHRQRLLQFLSAACVSDEVLLKMFVSDPAHHL
jgi:acyl-CoA thioester hydrolase